MCPKCIHGIERSFDSGSGIYKVFHCMLDGFSTRAIRDRMLSCSKFEQEKSEKVVSKKGG
jgi:hypothetical protein